MPTAEHTLCSFADLVVRASASEPQVIEGERPCVLISMAEYERLTRRRNKPDLGRWLIENTPRIGDIDLPSRAG